MKFSWLVPGLAFLAACSGEDRTGPTPQTSIALGLGGQHACYSYETATKCWGRGAEGQLGIGVTPPDTIPAQVTGAPAFVLLVGGASHTCGLDADAVAYCWGSNAQGQLGVTTELEQCPLPCATRPRLVEGNLRFQTLTAGTRHTCGITTTGSAYCWGLNDLGQLGTTATQDLCASIPCAVLPVAVESARSFTSITAGISHTCALESGGAAFCWGFQAGTTEGGNRNPQFRPAVVGVPGGIDFQQISAGGRHTCGVTSSGAAYCWGIDALGAGSTPLESDGPVAVGGGHRFKAVYSASTTSCGLDPGGAAYCWGPNSSGAVGTEPVGSTVRFDLPTPVSGGHRFTSLVAGQQTYCGRTMADDIVCWGRGRSGELGAGHEDSSAPVSVPNL